MSNYELRLKGYCRSEPELNDKGTVMSFKVPMSFNKKDKSGKNIIDAESGYPMKTTYWVRCVVFNDMIPVIQNMIRKGHYVELVGDMKPTHFQSESGEHVIGIDLIVKGIIAAFEPKPKEENAQQGQTQTKQYKTPKQQSIDNSDGFVDDDVPF